VKHADPDVLHAVSCVAQALFWHWSHVSGAAESTVLCPASSDAPESTVLAESAPASSEEGFASVPPSSVTVGEQ
jgi:hypothetical protein